jgi:hypothetical protein
MMLRHNACRFRLIFHKPLSFPVLSRKARGKVSAPFFCSALFSDRIPLTHCLPCVLVNSSVDEVNAEEMQQQAPKHKIRKRPLVGNTLKLFQIFDIGLHAQRRCEDELADGSAEAGEEGVEWLLLSSILAIDHHLHVLQKSFTT